MWIDDLEDRHVAVVEALIARIAPTAELAREVTSAFRALLQRQLDDEEDMLSLLDDVCEAGDGKCAFAVDVNDADSFASCIGEMAANWGVTLDLGPDTRGRTVPDLIRQAHAQLASAGLGLWGWDTGGDYYSGWIGRLSDAAFFSEVGDVLEVDLRVEGADF